MISVNNHLAYEMNILSWKLWSWMANLGSEASRKNLYSKMLWKKYLKAYNSCQCKLKWYTNIGGRHTGKAKQWHNKHHTILNLTFSQPQAKHLILLFVCFIFARHRNGMKVERERLTTKIMKRSEKRRSAGCGVPCMDWCVFGCTFISK